LIEGKCFLLIATFPSQMPLRQSQGRQVIVVFVLLGELLGFRKEGWDGCKIIKA